MAFYLHICRNNNNHEFLLISEQTLEYAFPEIKAQIYFDHLSHNIFKADDKTHTDPICIISYPISKKEIEILIACALDIPLAINQHKFREKGLFADGKTIKSDPFYLANFSSSLDIVKVLKKITLSKPEKTDYNKKNETIFTIDNLRVIDHKHKLFFNHLPIIKSRELPELKQKKSKILPVIWTKNEIVETNLLAKFNIIDTIINQHSGNKNFNVVYNEHQNFITKLNNLYEILANTKADVFIHHSPEAIRAYLTLQTSMYTILAEHVNTLKDVLKNLHKKNQVLTKDQAELLTISSFLR